MLAPRKRRLEFKISLGYETLNKNEDTDFAYALNIVENPDHVVDEAALTFEANGSPLSFRKATEIYKIRK